MNFMMFSPGLNLQKKFSGNQGRLQQTRRFFVKFLNQEGSTVCDTEMDTCNTVVREICAKFRNSVNVLVRLSVENGAEILYRNGGLIARYELQCIPFCFVSEDYPNMFAFLGHRGDQIICNVFECRDETEADNMYSEMSKIFVIATENQNKEKREKEKRLSCYSGQRGLNVSKQQQKKSKRRSYDGFVGSFQEQDAEHEGLMDEFEFGS